MKSTQQLFEEFGLDKSGANHGNRLNCHQFRMLYRSVEGELLGGYIGVPALMKQLLDVIEALPSCQRHYAIADETCDYYFQRRVYVAPKGDCDAGKA